MSDVLGADSESPQRRRIFDRWGQLLAGVVVLALLGVGAYQLGARDSDESVLFESAASIGPNPFTTSAVVVGVVPSVITMLPSQNATETTRKPGLYGGSGDPGVCDPAALVTFLKSQYHNHLLFMIRIV